MSTATAMTDPEKTVFLAWLGETRDVLLGSVAGVTEAQSRFRPAADRWSILDCAEHVAVVEQTLSRLITEKFTPAPRVPERWTIEQMKRGGADRSRKFDAPDVALPAGRFTSLAEAVERFRSVRGQMIAYIQNCRDDLRCRSTLHPHSFVGQCTAYDCLLLLAVHPGRHAEQIREVRNTPGFPKA